MRRVRHSTPRVRSRLFFPILFFVGLDLALLVLAAVLWYTPVHPNYPPQVPPTQSPQAPVTVIPVVPLPVGRTTPYKPPVAPRRTVVAHRPVTTAPKPSETPTTTLMATVTPKPSATKSAPTPAATTTTPAPTGLGD